MATKGNCPGCGRPLAADALEGLCPECLMKAGFGTGAAPAPGEPTARVAFTPPPLAELAKLFPQLEIVELLGQGGMGAVFKARQPALDRWIALKILPPHTAAIPGFSERFNREARALARLIHPSIVAVHESGQAGGLPYFIMEYVDGVTLRQLVQAKKLAPEQALAIVPQICEALQFAHDEGIVHRDIKPENILLDKKGRVKITDFGIAKIVEGEPLGRPPITRDQQVIGTPHYMAPEQVEKPHLVDHRADIYSLGVVFYEMLTGELPLGKFAPPSRKVQIDVRLDDVVLRTLEKEPERRYQQASEVKTEVERITSTALTPKPRSSSVSRGWKVALWAVGVVALLVLAVVTLPFVHFPQSSEGTNKVDAARQAPIAYGTMPATRGALTMVIAEAGRLTPASDDSSQWQIDASVPETSVVHIEVGQEVDCLADAFPGRVFKGRVVRIDDAPKAGLETATYNAVIQVIDPGLKFRRGMSVRLAFTIAHRPDALRIPSRALLFRMPGSPTDSTDSSFGLSPGELAMPDASERAARTIWVMRDKNQPEPVRIRIGITDGTFTEVVEGLTEGERVVIDRSMRSAETQPEDALKEAGLKGGRTLGLQRAPVPNGNANATGFGPVIERILDFDVRKETAYLDLDTGQYVDPVGKFAAFGMNATPAGVDLKASGFESDTRARLGVNMALVPVATNRWDATPAEIRKELAPLRRQAEVRLGASDAPQTYFFQTSEGGQGILQLEPTTEDSSRVRVRYKLVLANAATR